MEPKKQLTGLTDAQIAESRRIHGANLLTPPKRDSVWKLFIEKFEDPIIRILLIAAFLSLGISFVHQQFAETIGIFFAIFLATGVAFWFELDANKKFDLLNKINDETLVKVIRNGNICEVPKSAIVVGDLVLLNTGDEVPADGRLLEAVSLQINESSLTGEPVINKTTHEADFDEEATYPSNMVYRGTTVVDGHATIEITDVGDQTEYGKVARESTKMSGEETPLNKQLDSLAKLIGVIGFLLAIMTFLALFIKGMHTGDTHFTTIQKFSTTLVILSMMVALVKVWIPIVYDGIALFKTGPKIPKSIDEGGWIRWILTGFAIFLLLAGISYPFGINLISPEAWVDLPTAGKILSYFMVSVTLIVVAVPEGLPMSVTLSLALSMRRMLQSNNLVRKMHACETMGATTVICTDKTGTLTQNKMKVFRTNFFALEDQTLSNNEISNQIRIAIAVNSTAYLDFTDPVNVSSIGNPTEAALLFWLHDQGTNYLEVRNEATMIEQLTFSTERKYMGTIIESPEGKKVLFVKGAPEIVLNLCQSIRLKDKNVPVANYKNEIESLLTGYQGQAMRTLGFAYEVIEDDRERIVNGKVEASNLQFIGIAAISDPVREDVPGAVAECLNAGIDVKIVTGDTPGTAREIGRQIGIWKEEVGEEQLITGVEFASLSDEAAALRIRKLTIMCRARPTDKQRLVQLLQRSGSVVAVTGDGTNDAPALNFAHVGLSMGSGTSVAKEASDITLLDDSFKSIATAVMWGRSLYQNIQRFILFQLTINVTALVIVLLGSIFGREMPLTVTQMLWVNLIMDTFAAAALASLPPNKKVMQHKPRRNEDFIITRPMRIFILAVAAIFVVFLLWLLYYLTDPAVGISRENLSKFFTLFVMLQFWNLFNAKAFASGHSAFYQLNKSIGFIITVVLILTGQVLIVTFGGDVFRTVPISLKDWIIIVGATSSVLWIGETVRLFTKLTERKG
ncbi:MAG: calcium-translocating P-type ATPase, PMCA-type [Prolixibacteraceae bacterium]|nr:calcium-translocating P-type ATPase, PMCA-type [Prolixibacteraceae bacterium]